MATTESIAMARLGPAYNVGPYTYDSSSYTDACQSANVTNANRNSSIMHIIIVEVHWSM